MGLSHITIDDIQRSHRLGPKSQGRSTRNNRPRSRPIIVRFLNYRRRREVFKNKKNLKGQQISITENLTKKRYTLLKAAIDVHGFGNVWTDEGRVLAKVNNRIIIINSTDGLNE